MGQAQNQSFSGGHHNDCMETDNGAWVMEFVSQPRKEDILICWWFHRADMMLSTSKWCSESSKNSVVEAEKMLLTSIIIQENNVIVFRNISGSIVQSSTLLPLDDSSDRTPFRSNIDHIAWHGLLLLWSWWPFSTLSPLLLIRNEVKLCCHDYFCKHTSYCLCTIRM
jgi:hypothetical protein